MKQLKVYSFYHKRLHVKFEVCGFTQYEAINVLQGILGPEKHWIDDYTIFSTLAFPKPKVA